MLNCQSELLTWHTSTWYKLIMKKTTEETNAFDSSKHITQIKGKDYLEVKWRIVWMRSEHKDWGIETEIKPDVEKRYCIAKATIKDETGRVLAQAHKMEDIGGFGDYVEKSETGAVGRALALCGYGTQFSPDIEEGTERIVDSPVDKTAATGIVAPQKTTYTATPQPRVVNSPEDVQRELLKGVDLTGEAPTCAKHGKVLNKTLDDGTLVHFWNSPNGWRYCSGDGQWKVPPTKE